MTTITVLFNLKAGKDPAQYEAWAKSTDMPTVRSLKSVSAFEVVRSNSLLGSDDTPPYAYVEIIEVGDMDAFGGDISTETMQKVAGEFQEWADNPIFILGENL